MDRAAQLTRFLKEYDRELYCSKSREGKLCVYRNSVRWENYDMGENTVLRVARSTPHFIMALTHNAQMNGQPVEWGSLRILERLKKNDMQNRDIMAEMEKQYDEEQERQKRNRMNKTEDFMYEFRDTFKKTFNDYNTSTLDKKKDIRYLNDKKIKGD